MAIVKKSEQTDENKAIFEVNNGDLNALKEISDQWGFANPESALRFALAVLKQAKNETVYVEDNSGAKIGLKPSDSLKKSNDNGTDVETAE